MRATLHLVSSADYPVLRRSPRRRPPRVHASMHAAARSTCRRRGRTASTVERHFIPLRGVGRRRSGGAARADAASRPPLPRCLRPGDDRRHGVVDGRADAGDPRSARRGAANVPRRGRPAAVRRAARAAPCRQTRRHRRACCPSGTPPLLAYSPPERTRILPERYRKKSHRAERRRRADHPRRRLRRGNLEGREEARAHRALRAASEGRCATSSRPKASGCSRSSRERARAHAAGAEPGAARPAAAPRTLVAVHSPRTRAPGRHPEPVRAERVRPAVVVPRGLPPRPADARSRAPDGRPGDAHADDDPPRLRPGVLAVRGGPATGCSRMAAAGRQDDRLARCAAGRRSSGRRSSLAQSRRRSSTDDRAALGRTSSARRRRGRGSGAVRITMRSPSNGSGRARSRRRMASTISSARTSAASARPRSTTSRRGPASPARMLAPALDRLRLRRFRDEQGRELIDLAPRTAAAGRHAGADSLPALVGRGAARARPAHGRPARGVPPDRLRRRRTRRRCRRSSSTAVSRAPGATTTGASSSSRTSPCRARLSASSARRANGSRRS